MLVVDASIIVSLVNSDEVHHHQCRHWLHSTLLSGQQVYAPIIILAEIGAALSRGQHDPALAQKAVSMLSQETLIQFHPISIGLGQRAAAIAVRQRIRGCDAVYVALAEQLDAELITLDRQQLERGAAIVKTKPPPGV